MQRATTARASVVALLASIGFIAGSPGPAYAYTLTTLNLDDPAFNQLFDINNGGLISGYFGSGNAGSPNQGYPLTGGVATNRSLGVNDHNVAVAFYADAMGNNRGYAYNISGNISGGTFSPDINDPLNVSNVTAAKNDSGETFGFLDSNGTFTTVNVPGAIETQLSGLNDTDVAVGDYVNASGVVRGFDLNSFVDVLTTVLGAGSSRRP
jgi:hypothetical protein